MYQFSVFFQLDIFQVAVSSIRKLVHVIWAANRDEIPESVPKDVYYVYRLVHTFSNTSWCLYLVIEVGAYF